MTSRAAGGLRRCWRARRLTHEPRACVACTPLDARAARRPQVPEEFCDEITAEIMSDPVRLPSGKVVDRPTIARHLLSDETDPFNRQRCTLEMCIEDVELRERIQAFRKERREAAKASAMDTS